MSAIIKRTATSEPGSPLPEGSDFDWNIDGVVSALHELRMKSLASRQREQRPPKLPARKSLATIVERLGEALFPNRLAARGIARESVDYFVGHTLDTTLRDLVDQVQRELTYLASSNPVHKGDPETDQREQAIAIVRQFADYLPEIRALLESDIQAAYEGDPAANSVDEVLVCYPGVTAVTHHRLAHALYQLGAPLVARIIAEIAHSVTGIDIHPGAQIAERFFIDHGTGVVIGETAVIGKRVRLYQAVTLGAKRFPVDENGTLIKGNARHPILEDDVVVYAGATILGRVVIGRGSVIGGNVWLTHGVPPNSNISQAKVRSEEFESGLGI